MKLALGVIFALLLIACSSTPETIVLKPEYPRLVIYPRPELRPIKYAKIEQGYMTPVEAYADIVNNETKLKVCIESYENQINEYLKLINTK